MATSSFKSTSRRPNSSTSSTTTTKSNPLQPTKRQNPTQKVIPRRSRSVSAFSRTQLDITSDFHNTRDNPLFWVDGSETSNLDDVSSKFVDLSNLNGGRDSRRGRSVSRNSVGDKQFSGGGGVGGGRSLSRVDTSRQRRSPPRGRHYGNYEIEREQEGGLLSNMRSKSKIGLDSNRSLPDEKNKIVGSASDLSEVLKGWNTWSSQHPAYETSDDSAISMCGSRVPHWDDGMSSSAITEVEEKTIEPVSEERKITQSKEDNDTAGGLLETVRTEVRRAISDMQKDLKNATLSDCDVLSSNFFPDISPESENSNAVGLVTDIREEFTRELEECEERTRKLRAELAIEEHREVELNEILNNIIPEPQTPQAQKPCLLRKASTERKKMSKRLEEEAMAYFDECVSISTFDDSDFSSLEDPPSNMVRADNPGGETTSAPGVSRRAYVACSFETQDLMPLSPIMQRNEGSNSSANGGFMDSPCRSSLNGLPTKPQFSFSSKLSDSTSLEQDIRNYVKNFSKGKEKESSKSLVVRTVTRKTEDYNSEVPVEKFLLDRLAFRSRIESGSMLLCEGGIGFPRSPFSSNF